MRVRLRPLHVGERAFVWRAEIRHLRGRVDRHRCMGRTSRALQVDLLSRAGLSPWGACATDSTYPTSADIQAIIGCDWSRIGKAALSSCRSDRAPPGLTSLLTAAAPRTVQIFTGGVEAAVESGVRSPPDR